MIQNDLQNETEIRRFLMGEMREAERSAFEEKFVADADLFEQIRVSEDELIESYIRGTLDLSERGKFEKSFLTTKARRQRVDFTRQMLGKLSEYKEVAAVKKIETTAQSLSVWNSIIDFFKTPKLVFGAAFAVLILAFGFWLLVLKPATNETEIAREIIPTPIVSITPTPQTIENNSNLNAVNKAETNKPSANVGGENLNREIKLPEQSNPKTFIATLALFAGTVRSEGKTRELNLPKDAKGANLQLNLESSDYKTYRAEIVNPNGGIVYRSGKIASRKAKINFYIPAEKLQKGDYIVKLYGFNPQNEEESAADFQFRVNRK